jgi:hypothetical protein
MRKQRRMKHQLSAWALSGLFMLCMSACKDKWGLETA